MTARTAATEGFAVARSETDWDALDNANRTVLDTLFADNDPLVVDPTALERKFTIPERNCAMVREFREALEKGYISPNDVRRAPEWGKTIVLAVTKRHAETLARGCSMMYSPTRSPVPPSAAPISSFPILAPTIRWTAGPRSSASRKSRFRRSWSA